MNNFTSPISFAGDISVSLNKEKDNVKYQKALSDNGILNKLTSTETLQTRIDQLPDSFHIKVSNTDKGKVKAVLSLWDNPVFQLPFVKGKFDFVSDFLNQIVNFATIQQRNIQDRAVAIKNIVESNKEVIPGVARVQIADKELKNEFIWAVLANQDDLKTLPENCYMTITDSDPLNKDKGTPEIIVNIGDSYALCFKKGGFTTNQEFVKEVAETIKKPHLHSKYLTVFSKPAMQLPDNVKVMMHQNYLEDAKKQLSDYQDLLSAMPDGVKLVIKQDRYISKGDANSSSNRCPTIGIKSYLLYEDGSSKMLADKGSYETFGHFIAKTIKGIAQ